MIKPIPLWKRYFSKIATSKRVMTKTFQDERPVQHFDIAWGGVEIWPMSAGKYRAIRLPVEENFLVPDQKIKDILWSLPGSRIVVYFESYCGEYPLYSAREEIGTPYKPLEAIAVLEDWWAKKVDLFQRGDFVLYCNRRYTVIAVWQKQLILLPGLKDVRYTARNEGKLLSVEESKYVRPYEPSQWEI